MNDLSSTELKTLNSISRIRTAVVSLGTLIQSIISRMAKPGSPVNAVEATCKLVFAGVALDSEKVTIGSDVYEFLADQAQTKTNPTNFAVNITSYTTKASRVLTIDTQPTSGDTMTVGSKVYTFVPVGTDTADGEVSVGADLAGAKLAIVAAINGTDGINIAHPLVSAGAFDGNDCILTAFVGGTVGNSIATTETFTAATNIFGGATLAGGVDCTAANAVTALVASVNANDTEGVNATDGAGNVVDFMADVAGVAANSISVSETLSNGSFLGGAVALGGGVDGTVGLEGQIVFDTARIFVCTATNTISGKNWKQTPLGEWPVIP